MTLAELANHVAAEFEKRYGSSPRWIVAAPGRVNIIGEHTDYNDGFVLPMAIGRYAIMAADTAIIPGKCTVYDAQFKDTATIDLSASITKGQPKWSNYIRGVLAGLLNRGIRIPALNVVLLSTVPLGGGLSSSAALEICTVTLIEAATSKKMDPVDKALLAQKAEHDFADVPCGIMDQFVSALGREDHLLLLDCRTRETELVSMNDSSVTLLIVNTNVKHEFGSGEYAKRRAECELAAKIIGVTSLRDATIQQLEKARDKMSKVVYRRARHVIGEIERTVRTAQHIRQSDWPDVGDLMYASHASLCDDYEVSCQELETVVKIAKAICAKGGVYGCRTDRWRLWGCCVALMETDAVESVTKKIGTDYKAATGIEASIFSSRPAAGAMIIKS